MVNFDCPILIATRTGKRISDNPCNDCAFYSKDCLDDLARDLEAWVMEGTGAYLKAVKGITREYINRLIVVGRNQ